MGSSDVREDTLFDLLREGCFISQTVFENTWSLSSCF